MRLFAFALVVVGSALASREAMAQSFWYVPPGYSNGYAYGLDFGGGVGYGYGAAVGIPVSPQMLMGSYTQPYVGVQDFGDSFGNYSSNTYPRYSAPHPIKKAVKTASTAKNSHAKKKTEKVQHAKANS